MRDGGKEYFFLGQRLCSPASLKAWLGGLEENIPVFMKDGSIEANNVPRITLQE